MDNEKLKKQKGRSNDDNVYKRTYRLDLKLSKYEKELIENKYMDAGFNSMASYVRNCIFGGTEERIDNYLNERFRFKILQQPFLTELNRIGLNINQITKKINSVKYFTRDERDRLLKEHQRISEELNKIKSIIQNEIEK